MRIDPIGRVLIPLGYDCAHIIHAILTRKIIFCKIRTMICYFKRNLLGSKQLKYLPP